jgi:Uma2 family endonuclease
MKSMTIDQLDLNDTYTYADYLKWTFQERLELIKGRIFKMSPAPSRKHQEVSSNLHGIMYGFMKEHQCKLYSAPFDVRLTPRKADKSNKIHTVVQPDICVVCNLDKLDDNGCVGAPDFIIEILSPGNTRKEMKDKYEVYEENGVREYWIVHPNDKYILKYILDEKGKYTLGQHYFGEEIVESTVIPRLKIQVNDIFEE